MMFEKLATSGTPERGIALQTRAGEDIENQVAPKPSRTQVLRNQKFLQKYNGLQERRSPCGTYNCAGHVWASRRTSIYDETEYEKILLQDGYTRTDSPKVDDLVVYRADGPGITHVARVVRVETIEGGSTPLPIVVSKNCDWGGEFIHRAYDCRWLYEAMGCELSVEFWTDRESA